MVYKKLRISRTLHPEILDENLMSVKGAVMNTNYRQNPRKIIFFFKINIIKAQLLLSHTTNMGQIAKK